MDELQSVGSFEQFVLLSVVELSEEGETPAHSYEVTGRAKARLDDLDRDPFGGIEREEVIKALGSLAEADLLSKGETTSPVGKGRPAYDLAVEGDAVLDELRGEEGVGSYATTLANS